MTNIKKRLTLIAFLGFVAYLSWVAYEVFSPHYWRIADVWTYLDEDHINTPTDPLGLYCRGPNILIVNAKVLSTEAVSYIGSGSGGKIQVSGIGYNGHVGNYFKEKPDGFSYAYSFAPNCIMAPRIYFSHKDIFVEFIFRRINRRNNTCEVEVGGMTFKSLLAETLILAIQKDGSVVQIPLSKQSLDSPLRSLLFLLKLNSTGEFSWYPSRPSRMKTSNSDQISRDCGAPARGESDSQDGVQCTGPDH